jgi:genome maintenance exonuclease 1|tara:strand:- start:2909 stop:3586 length:678 start_codon:yes stop_codon:yes gene_type:complete
MGNFEHETIDLGYTDLVATTAATGRTYAAPTGVNFPSVTTVLSILSEDHIRAWRARVGEKEANKISRRASTRGTSVHAVLERYVDNEEDYFKDANLIVKSNFAEVKDILDKRLTKVYAQEAALYSTHLGVAGRVDCVGVWDGANSIIDYKTAAKHKKKEWCEGYFIQETAYAIMWEERTGMPITQLVTLIAGDEGAQVFIEHRDNWSNKLLETIAEYKRRKLFGR